MEKTVIFADEICDAKWNKNGLLCHKGKLVFSGDNVIDFRLYRAWCEGCNRKRIVDRNELKKTFKQLAKKIAREFE